MAVLLCCPALAQKIRVIVDHGASYVKTIFWDSTAKVPPYLRLAEVQFDIDAQKFYNLYIDLMTRPPRKR